MRSKNVVGNLNVSGELQYVFLLFVAQQLKDSKITFRVKQNVLRKLFSVELLDVEPGLLLCARAQKSSRLCPHVVLSDTLHARLEINGSA
jgi:hypothetical protein